MTRALLLALLGALAPSSLAQDPAAPLRDPLALFHSGVDAYRSGDHRAAREVWLAALEADDPAAPALERAAVYQNLGNAAFRLERFVEAAGWYTAGVRVAPRDADLWANLELARARADLPPADRGDLRATLARLATQLTLAEAEWLALACALLLAAALAFEALVGGRAARRVALAAAVLLALACVPWWLRLREVGRDGLFVVAPQGVPVRSEPRAGAAVVEQIEPADLAERIDAMPGWVRLRAPGGERGWVPAAAVLRLSAPERPADEPPLS